MLASLNAEGALFLIVGAHALAVHGYLRATGDLDIWVRPDRENAERVWRALLRFGAPAAALSLSQSDLEKPGTVFQIGLPPRRIDILTEISGVEFDDARATRVIRVIDDLEVPFLGRDALERNKRESGRDKDLADLRALTKKKV